MCFLFLVEFQGVFCTVAGGYIYTVKSCGLFCVFQNLLLWKRVCSFSAKSLLQTCIMTCFQTWERPTKTTVFYCWPMFSFTGEMGGGGLNALLKSLSGLLSDNVTDSIWPVFDLFGHLDPISTCCCHAVCIWTHYLVNDIQLRGFAFIPNIN